mmetsp:Transcript_20374/g.34332  ORF Transcript_20374/g.34332 Transcript_20374/m.34332 type:complete len:576 (+) Transcript_20374:176-1903(+)
MQPPNKGAKQLHRVVSTSSRYKNQSEETFISNNTLFSSVKANGDEIFDEKMQWEFYKFCFGFSMSCSTTVMAMFYSPMLTSEMIGGSGSGAFYLSFAYFSVGGAKLAVQYIGVKNAILWGHFGSSLYVMLFLIMAACLKGKVLLYLNILVAILGGGSQSVMWAGLGKYTLMMSNLLISSMETGVIRDMNRKLINSFALVYLVNLIFGFFLALILIYIKILVDATLLIYTLPVLLVYFMISSHLLWNADSLNDLGNVQSERGHSMRGVRNLLIAIADMETTSRHKLLLLLPYHVSWGINTAFWILYLVKTIFYEEISFLAAAWALFLSYAFSLLYTIMVKTIIPNLNHNSHILFGGLSSLCLGVFALSVDGLTKHQAREDYRIVVVFASMYGISMSVYENNMRAEVANLLQHYEVLAYSATSFAKTIAAGVCLVTSTVVLSIGKGDAVALGLEVELIISSSLGIAGFVGAVMLDRHSNNKEVVEHLEEKLLRESERNSIVSDIESLYSFKTIKSDSYFKSQYALHNADRMSNHTPSSPVEEGFNESEDDDNDDDGRSSRVASSAVTEDEFFVPDYF